MKVGGVTIPWAPNLKSATTISVVVYFKTLVFRQTHGYDVGNTVEIVVYPAKTGKISFLNTSVGSQICVDEDGDFSNPEHC